LTNFFSKTNDVNNSTVNFDDDNDNDDDDERNLFDILIDDQTESKKSQPAEKARIKMYSVLTGIEAISKVDEKGNKSLTGNSKDREFEKSNAFFDRIVAKAIHSYLILLNAGMG
jgi:hypothetical protein